MFSPFERLLAWRYLRSKKAEGFVSVITAFSFTGIMLGVATLIIVMSVMNGFRSELFDRILGLNGHMNVYAISGSLENYEGLRAKILPVEGIESITPIIQSQALLSSGGNSSGVMVRGISRDDFAARASLKNSITIGDLMGFDGNNIAIGSVLARKMNLNIGDKILLTSPKSRPGPFGSLPRQRSYDIAMVFDVGMYEYNSGYIFMPLGAAQIFFQMQDAVSSLEVLLNDPAQLDEIRQGVSFLIDGQASVYDWRDTNQSFYNALKTERNVMFLILTLIILVAAFNIISSMIMLVKDKGADIAILRTMGASRSSMLKIFMLTGASIGIAGTLMGAAIGIAFASNIESIRKWLEGLTGTDLFSAEIYFLSQLPAVIDWQEVISVILMALVISVAATIFPALRAARLDPVEALRYE